MRQKLMEERDIALKNLSLPIVINVALEDMNNLQDPEYYNSCIKDFDITYDTYRKYFDKLEYYFNT